MRVPRPLPQAFFARECLEVAADLLGKLLCAGPVVLRIAEVEAYRFPGDSANHCRFGKTARNAPMWGPAGHAYVYLCYGVHSLLNLVTDCEERGAAVLIRACEPVAGLEHVAARRRGARGHELLNGPGKVAAALGLSTRDSGLRLSARTGLFVADQPAVSAFRVGPRVGVDYADAEHRSAPWRLALCDSPWVSKPVGLRPLQDGVQAFLTRERIDPALQHAVPAARPGSVARPLRVPARTRHS
jgi:DNA-3-methyladenine glycosylase